MKIGTTRELKNHEYRVGLTPDNVTAFVAKGHTVYVETHAGEGAGFTDEMYKEAGATILATPAEVFAKADMIVLTSKMPDEKFASIKTACERLGIRVSLFKCEEEEILLK